VAQAIREASVSNQLTKYYRRAFPMSDTLTAPQQASPEDGKEPEKKKRRAGIAWWWLLVALAIAGLIYGPIWYWQHYGQKPDPAPAPKAEAPAKTHAEKQKVENAYFFRIDGKDKQGRAASFDFIMLTNEYTWVIGSTNELVSGGATIPEAEAAERVLTQQVRDSLSSASDLIGVGLASSEGEREAEEARALDRSKTVVGWITKVSKPETALWTLTLGQYSKDCKGQEDSDTSFERPVIFAGVRSRAEGAELGEALADAISGHDNLPSRECYSRFDLAKVR
jgi:hypothetical protein